MTGEAELLELIGQGQMLLEREHALLLTGDVAAVADLAEQKRAFVGALDAAAAQGRATPVLRDALARLIEQSRHNEQLLLAARRGVAAARRQIAAIRATGRGAVAYARDGSPIASRDDPARKSCRA